MSKRSSWSALEVIENAYSHSTNGDSMVRVLWQYGYEIRPAERSAGAAPLDVEPSTFAAEVAAELARARSKFGPVASLHEGYAVILEELDEFWEEVRGQNSDDRLRRAYRELVQVAAMAQRTAEDAIARLTEGTDR